MLDIMNEAFGKLFSLKNFVVIAIATGWGMQIFLTYAQKRRRDVKIRKMFKNKLTLCSAQKQQYTAIVSFVTMVFHYGFLSARKGA